MSDWPDPFFDEPETRNSIEKEIDWNCFINEVAFHEASHYVIARLIVRLSLGFREVNKINFCIAEQGEKFIANVGVIWPDLSEHTILTRNKEKIREYYLENEKRIFAETFNNLVGYVSYKVFFEKTEYFVSATDFLNNKRSIWYYNLERAFNSDIKDFQNVRKNLRYLNCDDSATQMQLIEICIGYLQDILAKKSISQSIRYVKNQILKHNCKSKDENLLEEIKSTVDEYTKNFDLNNWITKYAAHF